MTLVSEDLPEAPGPNASMQFGEATQTKALQREVASRSGGGANPQSPPPGQAPMMPQRAPEPPAQPAPGSPYQDQQNPRGADGRLDMSKIFRDLTTVPTWRQQAKVWADYPHAPGGGQYLKMLGRMSKPVSNGQ